MEKCEKCKYSIRVSRRLLEDAKKVAELKGFLNLSDFLRTKLRELVQEAKKEEKI